MDTSAWVAAQLPRDRHHEAARVLFSENRAAQLVTSNHVVGETWTFLRAKQSHHAAVAFLDMLAGTRTVEVVFAGSELEHEALEWLRIHDERPYSFVDATSFALMRHGRMYDALAFDGDFTAAGFVELRA